MSEIKRQNKVGTDALCNSFSHYQLYIINYTLIMPPSPPPSPYKQSVYGVFLEHKEHEGGLYSIVFASFSEAIHSVFARHEAIYKYFKHKGTKSTRTNTEFYYSLWFPLCSL